jgi:hypothetical protein
MEVSALGPNDFGQLVRGMNVGGKRRVHDILSSWRLAR